MKTTLDRSSTRRSAKAKRRSFFGHTQPLPSRRSLRVEQLESRHLLAAFLDLQGVQTLAGGTNVNVSADAARVQAEMSVDVNPTNPLNLAGLSHRIGGGIAVELYYSNDGGSTWTTNAITNGVDGFTSTLRFDPTIAYDGDGRLYVGYGIDDTVTNTRRIVVGRSSDGGATFDQFSTVDTGTFDGPLDKLLLATGLDPSTGNQAVYIAYSDDNFDDLLISGSNNGGAAWTTPLIINDDSFVGGNDDDSRFPKPAVGPNGELYVGWQDLDDGQLKFDRDLDGLFGSNDSFGADVVVANLEENLFFNPVPAQPERGIFTGPVIDVDRSGGPFDGTIYFVYGDTDDAADDDSQANIYLHRSLNEGATWSSRILVDDGTGAVPNNSTEFHPWISVDPTTGSVNVSYYTSQGDEGSGNNDVNIRLATSTDGGLTFPAAQQTNLTSATSNAAGGYAGDYLEYFGLAVRDGTAHALWSDQRGGAGADQEAFTAAASFNATSNVLTITGDDGGVQVNDDIFVRLSAANSSFLEIIQNGAIVFAGLLASVDQIIVNTLFGDDNLTIEYSNGNPIPAGGLTYNAGAPTGSDTFTVVGSTGGDTFSVQHVDEFEADVTVNGGAVIDVNDAELLVIDGGTNNVGGGDDLTVLERAGRATRFVHTPGVAPDSGRIDTSDSDGDTLIPIVYRLLDALGTVTLDGGGVNDTLVALGTSGSDVFNVAFTGTNAADIDLTTTAGTHVDLRTIDVGNYILEALEGDDTINLSAPVNAVSFVVHGDDPGGSDVLFLTGAAATAESVTIAPDATNPTEQDITGLGATIDVSGVELIRYTGAGSDDTLTVALGNGSNIARVESAGGIGFDRDLVTSDSLPDIEFTEVDIFVVNPGLGADQVTFASLPTLGGATSANYRILGGSADTLVIEGQDAIDGVVTVTDPAGAPSVAVAEGSTVVTDTLGDLGRLQINSLGGDDGVIVDVNGTGGAIGVPITFDGGLGSDLLRIIGTPLDAAGAPDPFDRVTYTPGPAVGQGRLEYTGPSMLIDFLNLEPVIDLTGAASLVANGTNADNAINYTGDTEIVSDVVVNTGVVSIDGFETIEFANKANLTLNGLAGSDTINLHNPNTPAGLTSITVNGGDPTASDTLIVNGTSGADAINFSPTAADAGTVLVNAQPLVTLNTVEHLTINGQGGGDDLTVNSPANGDIIEYTPGGVNTFDTGLVTMTSFGGDSRLSMDFLNLGVALSSLVFLDTGAINNDNLFVNGTANDDVFEVTSAGVLSIREDSPFLYPVSVDVTTTAISFLTLRGLDGDDTFIIPGNHPYRFGVSIEAGNPSASDVLNFTGSGAGAVTVNLGAQTVGEAGFAAVSLSGIEILNVDANANLTILGAAGDETLDVSPTGANSGTAESSLADSPLINFTDAGTFTVDLLAGDNTLIARYSSDPETIDVNGPAGTIGVSVGGPFETVNFLNVDSLRVFGNEGDDTFNVTPVAAIPIFIDGGDPIGIKAPFGGDTLSVAGAVVFAPGPEVDEGGYLAPGAQIVSFDHIENFGPIVGLPCVIILGTNGDDDITVLARDASYNALADGVQDFTVSVNGGPDILYIDVPELHIDALAGDDDIVLRTPAPNGAVWDVDVFIAGGSPAAPTGDQGDVFELETPGSQTVTFTPSGPDSGVIDVVTLSTVITLGTFVDACPPLNYDSSLGGVETIVYDGVTAFGADNFTINGQFNDTTNFDVASLAGTYRSLLSPDLDFSLVGALTVNAGVGPFDVVNITGSAGDDVVTSNATTITVNTPGAFGTVTLGAGIDLVTLSTLDGNDNIDLDLNVAGLRKSVDAGAGNDTVNMAGTIDADIFGGDGDDTLIGSPAADNIYGGFGNDILIGGGGVDNQYGEEGQDTFGNPNLIANGVADDPGNDNNFGGPGFDNFVWEPGDGNDSNNGGEDGADIFRVFGGAGVNVIVLRQGGTPTHLNVDIDAETVDNHGIEDVVVSALAGADTVTVQDIFATEAVTVNVDVGAADGAIDSVTVNGRNVADNMLLSLVAGQLRLQGLRYNVNMTSAAPTDQLAINGNDGDDLITAAAGTSAAVTLTLAGGAGNDTLDASATTLTGVFLEGDAGDDTLLGGSGNDSLRGEAGAIFGNDTFVGNGGTDAVGAGGGLLGDRILVPGTPGNDVITLALNGAGHLLVTINGLLTTYTDFIGGPIVSSLVDLIAVVGGEGNDRVTVDSSNGAVPIAIEYDGGSGSDSLTLTGGVATADTYSVGPNPGQGTSTIVIGGVTQLVTFQNIEPVIDLVAGPLVVNATPADNAINFAANVITIDNFESIAIGNKTDVTINAGSGSDTININDPAGLSGAITVNGGNPTASDTVIVNGTSGADTVTIDQLTLDGARIVVGAGPTINIATAEHLTYSGQGGDDTLNYTTPGGTLIEYTPGVNATEARLDARQAAGDSLIPVNYVDVAVGGTLVIDTASGSRLNTLNFNGTAADDEFNVTSGGDVQIDTPGPSTFFKTLLVETPGVILLRMLGGNGDDIFNVPGNHPFPGIGGNGIEIQGGNPSASDVLNFNGAGAAITVDLAAQTVTEAGFAAVDYSGIEVINVDANADLVGAGTLAVTATATDDDLTVTVYSATSGKIEIGYAVQQNGQVDQGVAAPLINYSDITPGTALSVDLAGGEDTLVVVGNALTQTFIVNTSAAPFDPPLPGGLVAPPSSVLIDDFNDDLTSDGLVTYTNSESLSVFGLEGADLFNVVAGAIPVFIDGGDPIGVSAVGQGDTIVPFGTIALFPGPEPDEGGFLSAGEEISFDHIEDIVVPSNGDDCPFLILGTNGDDDITVIARNEITIGLATFFAGADGVRDFTVSVNAGPDVLFLDEPDLFIDALNGDDDIVVRTPAPNDALWDVNVRVAGGPPSIGETNEADRLVLETPGTDIIEFRPTGPDTGRLVINEDGVADYQSVGDDSIITFGPFVFQCIEDDVIVFTYLSSPGGVELVEYDGEDGEADPLDGIVDDPDDTLAIFAPETSFDNDTTTTVSPQGVGSGTFVSGFSPIFHFRSFEELIVNGGAPGFDHVIVNATAGPDTITSDSDTITLNDPDLNHFVTLGPSVEQLNINTFDGNDSIDLDLQLLGLKKVIDAGAGNDTVNLLGVIVDPADPVIFGGIGDDTIIGSPNIDLIFGGSGNDVLIGAGNNDTIYGEEGNDRFGDPAVADPLSNDSGNDLFFGGDGSDTFVWDPGDGSDLIEGGSNESDLLIFNGSGAEIFTLNAVGTRLELLRSVAAIDMDIAGVEQVNLNAGGGIDVITVNDLFPTDVRVVNLDYGPADAAADTATINGRNVSDNVNITAIAALVAVTGLRYDVNITSAVAGNGDAFIFNGNNGNDTIVSPADASLTPFFAVGNFTLNGGLGDDFVAGYGVLNGNEGNDTLVGGSVGQTINGGDGDDQIFGGDGADILNGNAGEDTFVPGFDEDADTVNGGTDFDTILVQGNSANNRIDAIQDSAIQVRYEISGINGGDGIVGVGGGTETDSLTAGTVEQLTILAGSGDDIIRVAHADALVEAGVFANVLRFTVDGGPPGASDRLTVTDLGAGDTTIHRIGGTPGDGSFTMYAFTNDNPALPIIGMPPVVYTDIEFASLNPVNPVTGDAGELGGGQLFVFKHDPFESNDTRLNATLLGSNSAINVDPTIDPGADPAVTGFDLPGDEDWYRVVPQFNGDLDIRVFHRIQGTLANGRAGLPGQGNLDIALYDADGQPIPIGGTGAFGTNDTSDDERIRIPAVEGQTYYLRVRGAPDGGTLTTANHAIANTSSAINVYNVSVINTPAPVPFDLELDDVIATSTVTGGQPISPTAFSGDPLDTELPNVNGFFAGKDLVFTSGPLNGQRGRILTYTGATRTFTFAAGTFTGAPVAGNSFQIESVDTGRSQLDDITRDNTPTIFLRVADSRLLLDIPENGTSGEPGLPPDATVIPIPFEPSVAPNSPNPGFRVAIIHVENNTHTIVGYAQPRTPPLVPGGPGVYEFTFTTPLADGSHFISARVEMIDPANPEQAQGLGALATSLEIVVDTQIPPVFFGLPNLPNDGLAPGSDSGIGFNQPTLVDRITNDTTPTFFGQAEADAVIRLYADVNNDGLFQPATDIQIGFDVAEPLDGTNQYPQGYWEITSNVNLNSPIFPLDGLRRIFVSAEDVAGNINNAPPNLVSLEIFIDTQGPQVTDVEINNVGNPYDLFDPKPSTDGPTPLVNSLVISFQDLPPRVAQFLYVALKQEIAETPGIYQVKGDYNGIIPIRDIIVTNNAPVIGLPATATVELVFREPGPDGVFNTSDDLGQPLFDDRYTLTIDDELQDIVGNHLDGESNASEPQEDPTFPSGDGVPGGDFVARFTIDSRPELGVWAAGSAFLDINGNTIWDPDNLDFTNRDITHVFGYVSDDLFAGRFATDDGDGGLFDDGFDKLGAYGRVGTSTFRWLIDTDNDGVPDVEQPDPANVNGKPVAGNFALGFAGDEVGLFTGTTWFFDTNHNFQVDTSLSWGVTGGSAIVGDFDGDGLDDLATWSNDVFSFDLSSIGGGGPLPGNPGINGAIDRTFKFGFPGPGERPVAADMNQDGIEDVGLWMPARDGITPRGQAEWYFLISGVTPNDTAPNVPANLGPTITGTNDPTPGSYAALPNGFYGLTEYTTGRIVVDPLFPNSNIVRFQAVPFGNDQYMQFGDEFALPLLGNFDPPVASSSALAPPTVNPRNQYDVNNDGKVNQTDLLVLINYMTVHGIGPAPTSGFIAAPFVNVNGDSLVNSTDLLVVLNYLTQHPPTGSTGTSGAEGEGGSNDAYFNQLGSDGDAGDDDELLDLLARG